MNIYATPLAKNLRYVRECDAKIGAVSVIFNTAMGMAKGKFISINKA